MRFDALAKLRHLLQTIAFCLAVATLLYAFSPEKPYAPAVTHALCIGLIVWAIIDLGRHLFPSAQETGWPAGVPGLLLVAGGIAAGYLLGTTIADQLCRAFGWYGAFPGRERTNDLRTSLLVTVMAGVAGTYYFYSANRSRYFERKMAEEHQHANEARLKLLEAQLEPHMLFNTLANLRALIATDPARAQQMLDHMIAYLRATLNASRSTSHTLEDEFERLRDYLELMAIRMGPRLAFTLDLPPALARQPVPALLLQPLVENSIKHGLEPQVAGGRITVSARREQHQVVLEVADTGIGLGDANGAKGFGLAQIRERLAALYGPAAAIEFVAGDARGTRASVRFPSAS
jgi:two-component sensor histidine kinase